MTATKKLIAAEVAMQRFSSILRAAKEGTVKSPPPIPRSEEIKLMQNESPA